MFIPCPSSRNSIVFTVFWVYLVDTTTYNRTISSNVLVLSTEEAVTQLGCAGMAIGSSIDLLNPEELVCHLFSSVVLQSATERNSRISLKTLVLMSST